MKDNKKYFSVPNIKNIINIMINLELSLKIDFIAKFILGISEALISLFELI
nr:hypothetical protein [Clostridium intestinale]